MNREELKEKIHKELWNLHDNEWTVDAIMLLIDEYTKPKTKAFKMCFHPSNVGKAIEAAKKVIEHPLFRNSKDSFFQMSAVQSFDRKFPNHVWFEITYSREFLIYLFGSLMKN